MVLPYYSVKQHNLLKGPDIYINGVILEQVNVYTYLGIRLDSHLTMKNHLDHLYHSAIPMMFSLYIIRRFIDTKTAVLIFKAHVLSRWEYGSELCIGTNNPWLEKLMVRRNIALMKLMYDRLSKLKRPNDSNERIVTRGERVKKLPIPFERSNWFYKSITYQGPSRWLKLPSSLKKCDSIEEFSKSLRERYSIDFIANGVIYSRESCFSHYVSWRYAVYNF